MKTLWFVMTRTCNLDCSYCYQGSHKWSWQKDKGLTKHMTDEVMVKTLKWMSEWEPKDLKVIFYGGEPLLQKDLIIKWVPVYKKAGPENIKFSCTTNGTLLTKEIRDFFDEYETSVLLSLDGPPWIHDKQRTYYGDKPSWESIPIDEILEWRPNLEIAWQLDPTRIPTLDDLLWMRKRGFRCINFNINWLQEWPAQARLNLTEFMRGVGRMAIAERNVPNGFRNNLFGKFNEIFLKGNRDEQPCGTGLNMLAVTPEGWLYPSQEMAFTVMEPNRAPGTDEYYRVGNVHNDPVINEEVLKIVSTIRNDEMRQPPGFDCNNCAAKPISFGGCHCRYVGIDGTDPSNRYDVLPGWCQSEQAWVSGFLQAAAIEGYLTFKTQQQPRTKHQPVSITDVLRAVNDVKQHLNKLDIVQIERV